MISGAPLVDGVPGVPGVPAQKCAILREHQYRCEVFSGVLTPLRDPALSGVGV